MASYIAGNSHRVRETYVWFSPFGLANHETPEKTAMKMMLMIRDHLMRASAVPAVTSVASLTRSPY